MKYLLVLLVVVIAIGIWRSNRRAEREAAARAKPAAPPPPASGPAPMLSCARCGLHLPAADTVPGRDGAYCSAEHRQLSEG